MKRANTMSTTTVELTIKVKTKFTSSNAEKIKWIHLTTDVGHLLTDVIFSHSLRAASSKSYSWYPASVQAAFTQPPRFCGVNLTSRAKKRRLHHWVLVQDCHLHLHLSLFGSCDECDFLCDSFS